MRLVYKSWYYDPLEVYASIKQEDGRIQEVSLTIKKYSTDTGRRVWNDEQILKSTKTIKITSREELKEYIKKEKLDKRQEKILVNNIFAVYKNEDTSYEKISSADLPF